MNEVIINKQVTAEDLERIFESFFELEKEIIKELKVKLEADLNNGKLYKLTHYLASISNRAISLNRGFYVLANSNNYLTAASLIRLQIDNCLRFFAMIISEDQGKFYDEVMNGTSVGKLKDKKGNKMTDAYLVGEIKEIFPEFETLYKNTSGFIHFSKSHIHFNNKATNIQEENLTLRTTIGDIEALEVYEKVDYAFNMFIAGKNFCQMIKFYKESKISTSK